MEDIFFAYTLYILYFYEIHLIDQHATLSEKFLKKWFWLYLFSFIIAPIGYIIKIIISWELSVSEVWILYGVISLITIVSAYNDFGMSESINHFVPKYVTQKRFDKVKSILIYAFTAQMLTGVSIALIFFFWADFIAENYFKSPEASGVLKVFAFYFLGINIFQILGTFFSSIQNTFAFKVIDFFRMWLIMLVTLYIFFWDLSSLIYYSYAWIIGLYLGIIIAIVIFYKTYFNKYFAKEKLIWSKNLLKEIFTYWFLVFLWSQASVILSQIDMQMVIYMLGTQDWWYYTNYLSIISISFMVIGPIFSLLFPIFSEMHSKWETKKITLVKEIFTNNFLIIGIAFNFFFFAFSLPITYILFWEKFLTSWIILQYSVLFLTFNYLLQINFNILAWVWRVWVRAKIIGIALIINILTNILFINIMWVSWAALATGLWWILIWLMSEYVIKWEYKIQIKHREILKNIIVLWGFSGIFLSYFWNYWEIINEYTRVQLFIVIFIIFIIYSSIFIWINLKNFKHFIWEIRRIKKW